MNLNNFLNELSKEQKMKHQEFWAALCEFVRECIKAAREKTE